MMMDISGINVPAEEAYLRIAVPSSFLPPRKHEGPDLANVSFASTNYFEDVLRKNLLFNCVIIKSAKPTLYKYYN